MEYRYQDICGKNLHRLNISIGGDNYCYDNMLDRLISANRMFHRQGAKTVLYGCSIEPELLKRPEIMEDMKRYDAIVARESLTFAALQEAGIDKISIYIRTRLFTGNKAGSPAGGLGSRKDAGPEHQSDDCGQ